MSANPCATPRRVAPSPRPLPGAQPSCSGHTPAFATLPICVLDGGFNRPSPAGPSRQRRAKPTYRAEKRGASPISRCYEILFGRRESHGPPTRVLPPPSSPFVLAR
jgi:hypothetical protein